jgi:hypothetical protein
MVGVRLKVATRTAVEAWAKGEADKPSLSEAVRRLIDLGLTTGHASRPRHPKAVAKAADMAGSEIDRLEDKSATEEERPIRKRRLIKGPREFREMRSPKAKTGK